MTKRYRVNKWKAYAGKEYTNYYFQSLKAANNFMKDIFKHIHDRITEDNKGWPHDHMEGLPTIEGEGLKMKIKMDNGGYDLTEVKD